jgi:hypothetical protein
LRRKIRNDGQVVAQAMPKDTAGITDATAHQPVRL